MIDTLIRVGLFIDQGATIEVSGWSNWNHSADEVETMSKGGLKGNHLRHHVNRRLWGKSCAICKEQKSRGLSLAESPTDRPPSRREDEDFDLDVDQSGGDNAPLGPRKDAEELSLRELDDLRAHEQWRIEQGLDDSTASAAS